MNRHLLVLALTAALAACGGGGHGGHGGETANAPADTATPPRTDSFISSVLALINGGSDTSEPSSVEAFQATTPEDAEPLPTS